MNKLLLVSFFVISASFAKAQQSVIIKSDPLLDSLIEAGIASNKISGGMAGFRIQIYFGSERKTAMDARTRFLQQYPDHEAYLIYQQPYFKVRAGDFRSRFEAYGLYKQLLGSFDKVFIVPDKINFPKI